MEVVEWSGEVAGWSGEIVYARWGQKGFWFV